MRETDIPPIILVVEDVQETRDGIGKLLNTDGYLVEIIRTRSQLQVDQ